jgi:transposase
MAELSAVCESFLPPSQDVVGRGDLTDAEWARLEPLLPPQRSGKAGRPPHDHRRLLNGLLWLERTGARWCDLPSRYGKWQTVASRFYRWLRAGVWDDVLVALRQTEGAEGTHGCLRLVESAVAPRLQPNAAWVRGRARRPGGATVVALPPPSATVRTATTF